MKFPKHEAGLSLEHNEHKNYYISVEQHITDLDLQDAFLSKEEMQEAIDTDSLWVLHWYPHTPVGFCRIAAPTLEKIFNHLKEKHGNNL